MASVERGVVYEVSGGWGDIVYEMKAVWIYEMELPDDGKFIYRTDYEAHILLFLYVTKIHFLRWNFVPDINMNGRLR